MSAASSAMTENADDLSMGDSAGLSSTADYDTLANRAAVSVVNNTLANYAIGLLVTIIVLMVAALVAGEFAAAIPEESEFGEAIDTIVDSAGTAFVLFGVAVLVIPAVGVVVLIVNGFGGMMGGGMGR